MRFAYATRTDILLGKVQVVVEPLPRLDFGNAQARGTVGKWREEEEAPDKSCDNDTRGSPGSEQGLSSNALPDRLATGSLGDGFATFLGDVGDIGRLKVEDEFNQGACYKRTGEVCRKVVMQEELAAHDEEWNVVGSPGEEEEAGAVIQTRASAWNWLAWAYQRKEDCETYAYRAHPHRDEC